MRLNRRMFFGALSAMPAVACAEQLDVGWDPPRPGSGDTGDVLIDRQRNHARQIFIERIGFAVSEYAKWSREDRETVLQTSLETLKRHVKKLRKELEAENEGA